MECKLLRPLDNDVFARGIPPNHMVVLRTLEQAVGETDVSGRRAATTAGTRER